VLFQAAEARGQGIFTATPEFGPDGYLQIFPGSHEPLANLHELNRWMAQNLEGITKAAHA